MQNQAERDQHEFPTSFPAVNRCIYCGKADAPLTDEHIIAFSLHGTSTLPKASCESCAKVTSYLDGYFGRHVYFETRLLLNIPTRRPKERPTHLSTEILIGENRERRVVPVADYPHMLVVPVFPPPDIFAGRPRTELYRGLLSAFRWPGSLNEHAEGEVKAVAVYPDRILDTYVFARGLAKIAHGACVARFGLDAFEPLLPKLILGHDRFAPYLVGCRPVELPPWPAHRHYVGFDVLKTGGGDLIRASVRLFCQISGSDGIGTPLYDVAVGRPLGKLEP